MNITTFFPESEGASRGPAFFVAPPRGQVYERVNNDRRGIPDEYWKFSGFTRFRLPECAARRIYGRGFSQRPSNSKDACAQDKIERPFARRVHWRFARPDVSASVSRNITMNENHEESGNRAAKRTIISVSAEQRPFPQTTYFSISFLSYFIIYTIIQNRLILLDMHHG